MYDYVFMNGNELLKKIKKWAKDQNVNLEIVKAHGKGSHSTLRVGQNKTTIKDLNLDP